MSEHIVELEGGNRVIINRTEPITYPEQTKKEMAIDIVASVLGGIINVIVWLASTIMGLIVLMFLVFLIVKVGIAAAT